MTETTTTSSPLRRAAHAYVLMVPLLSLFYVPTLFLVDSFVDASDGFIDIAFVVVAMFTYIGAVVALVPAIVFTIGRWMDAKLQGMSTVRAAGVFAAVAAGFGLFPGIPFTLEGRYGVLPLMTFVLAPALAAFLTRLILSTALSVTVVRIAAIVLTAAVGGSLVALAIWNVMSNSA